MENINGTGIHLDWNENFHWNKNWIFLYAHIYLYIGISIIQKHLKHYLINIWFIYVNDEQLVNFQWAFNSLIK